jgi:GNAT superfamily N-acetyltransferase
VPEIVVSVVDPGSADARWAMERYFDELDERIAGGFDRTGALDSAASAFVAPNGVFLLVQLCGSVAGCGAVQYLDGETAEIKRMWVSPSARGQGVGLRLLAALEAEASGRARVVLDTNGALTEAIAMYRRAGYTAIEPYNDNPHAEHWFEKRLS